MFSCIEVKSNDLNRIKTNVKEYFIPSKELSKKQLWVTVAIAVAAVASLILSSVLLPTPLGVMITIPASTILGHSFAKLAIHFLRFATRKFKERNDGKGVHDKDVILFVSSKYDNNGAISLFPPGFIKVLLQKKYKIVLKEVSSLDDIQDAIELMKKQNNHIHSLWINAHGNSKGFSLDQTEDIRQDVLNGRAVLNNTNPAFFNVREKIKNSLSSLDKDSVIVLQSCSTGNVDSEGKINIAQTIASAVPNHRVIAPTQDIALIGTEVRDLEKMDIRFRCNKRSLNRGVFGKIKNVCHKILFLYSGGSYGRNVTARFCDTQKI